jgi:uncharacterized protein YceH (UPF0502 family)
MSSDVTPQPPPPAPPTWEPLSVLERRVLGVLIEKQKTSRTADAYPLTLNALTVGCNQKSNRDPVLDLTDDEVDEVVIALQKKGHVTRVTGSRVDRFRHELYESWTRNGPQLAVLAELLLRGPQTKGELRGRAARMDPIDTLDALEEVLKPLVERRLVVYLGEPDRRGTLVTHGFHTPDELARLRTGGGGETGALGHVPAVAARADVVDEIARLKAAVAALEAQMADLRKHLGLS